MEPMELYIARSATGEEGRKTCGGRKEKVRERETEGEEEREEVEIPACLGGGGVSYTFKIMCEL